MSYIKADDILPKEIIDMIQNYIDGEYLYIPRKADRRKAWGEKNDRKRETLIRNQEIYRNYLEGMTVESLSEKYFLAPKSIRKIIAVQREQRGSSI